MALTRRLLLALASTLLLACGGGGGGTGTDVNPGTAPAPAPSPDPDPTPAPGASATGRFPGFESGQVRPLALSRDGSRLYAVNTPDNRVEIFDLSSGLPSPLAAVRVGLEPVALALRNDAELWVVNHLSDSVSIVDVAAAAPHVQRTLLVGDEPRDIVFAGDDRAFISTAHRGQNAPFDPELLSPGIGRADVWVFDAGNPGDELGGRPLAIINLFGDTPRPLAVSPDGSRVYAAVFHSGNGTTVASADIAGGGLDKPGPARSADGSTAPRTGLIVRFDGRDWRDAGDPSGGEEPQVWSDRIRFSLPDYDLFEIDALATPPVETKRVSGIGTTLFNIAVNPISGTLYVSNSEARNQVRFEGAGIASSTVRGHFVENRLTVVDASGPRPRHLNKHIASYDADLGSEAERDRSLAIPLGMAVSADGTTLYLAAFGSGRIAVFDVQELEQDRFAPSAAMQIELSAGGPSGLALDERRRQLYVLTRFDNGLSTIDLDRRAEIDHLQMFNPEPPEMVNGRPFLYDARLSSSRGDSSCAGCHVFGDTDHLSWDLGNPDDERVDSPNRYNEAVPASLTVPFFHPLKGPMSTQSLRGLSNHGPMHWRGDRTGQSRDAGESVEEQAFEDFNVAFTGLLGRDEPLPDADMHAFARFALELDYPPNPYRALDNSLSPEQQAGADFYFNVVSDTIATCNGCHVLDEDAGLFGSDGTMSIEGGSIDEDFKIPHLRNAYQKVGMFGSTGNPANGAADLGPQVRGFGYAHDGSVDTLVRFLSAAVFAFPDARTRRQVADFVLAFPSELAPIVGQQITLNAANSARADVGARLDLLLERAAVITPRPECELVVSGIIDGSEFAALRSSSGDFITADPAAVERSLDELRDDAAVPGNALTFTCVPPGHGRRIAIDRDADGLLDGAE